MLVNLQKEIILVQIKLQEMYGCNYENQRENKNFKLGASMQHRFSTKRTCTVVTKPNKTSII
jgi:hypothetical protein